MSVLLPFMARRADFPEIIFLDITAAPALEPAITQPSIYLALKSAGIFVSLSLSTKRC